MANYYDVTRARGGKDDFTIERGLLDKIDELKADLKIEIRLERYSPWEGKDRVRINSVGVYFLDKKDHTFSPVVIKATVRMLHRHGFRGYFDINVYGDIVTVQPVQKLMKQRGKVFND